MWKWEWKCPGDSVWTPPLDVACPVPIEDVDEETVDEKTSKRPRKSYSLKRDQKKHATLMVHLLFEKDWAWPSERARVCFSSWHSVAREFLPKALMRHPEYKTWCSAMGLAWNDTWETDA